MVAKKEVEALARQLYVVKEDDGNLPVNYSTAWDDAPFDEDEKEDWRRVATHILETIEKVKCKSKYKDAMGYAWGNGCEQVKKELLAGEKE